jgi:hypothetical protein
MEAPGETTSDRELRRLAILNGSLLRHAAKNTRSLKRSDNLTTEDLEEQCIVFCPSTRVIVNDTWP